jgi:hypothetical protein
VAGGALNGGDTDEAVARALGLPFVGLPPFGTVDADAERSVAALARDARVVVVCDTPFGGANLGNLMGALAAAPHRLVFVGGDPAPRDFTGAAAAALVAGALGAGATPVADDQEALALVERMLP